MFERLNGLKGKIIEITQFLSNPQKTIKSFINKAFPAKKYCKELFERVSKLEKYIDEFEIAQYLGIASSSFYKTKSVIFVGGSFLGCNVKYAFLSFYAFTRNKGIEVYYLPSQPCQEEILKAAGLPCLPYDSKKWTSQEIKILMSAKVVVESERFEPPLTGYRKARQALLQGAKHIQLWHGIPLKRIGYQELLPLVQYSPLRAEYLAASGVFDLFIASGKELKNMWSEVFSFKEFAAIGYPRNDLFFRDLAEGDMLNVDEEVFELIKKARNRQQTIVLYAPTFRDNVDCSWIKKSEIANLAASLESQGNFFCVKLHCADLGFVNQLRNLYKNVYFINPSTDIYPIVKFVDILITDYSSLAFDFLLLNRPIIFYRPDHENYIKNSRALIEEHMKWTAGEIVFSIEDLIKSIKSSVLALQDPLQDSYFNIRKVLREKLFDYNDGKASERLNELILQYLNLE